MFSELTGTAAVVPCQLVVATTEGETAYMNSSVEFLKKVKLLQAVNLYALQIINDLQKRLIAESESSSKSLISQQNV